MPSGLTKTHEVLLRRRGLVFMEASGGQVTEAHLRAVDIKLADLGFALSARLRERLGEMGVEELTGVQDWMWSVLAEQLGGDRKHTPLFRKFPYGIPDDTSNLWLRKVVCHFLQGEEQPCLFCRQLGTTHVLNPCHHVVCDHCFDGSNYSACPVCEREVDLSSPFFKPSPQELERLPKERITLKLLDLGCDIADATKSLFVAFCQRTQAMTPGDKKDFTELLRGASEHVIPWIPESIPLKENVALVFGTLFRVCDASVVLPVARDHLKTATDVLRFLAAISGADPSLQGQTIYKSVREVRPPSRWWGKIAEALGAAPPGPTGYRTSIPIRVKRFKVARLPRSLRRALLSLLDGMDSELLIEDMLRHRSYWVWLGEFLHPHEYATRFPNAARAFQIVRKRRPDGAIVPRPSTYYSRLEAAAKASDVEGMTKLLRLRPGELARRFDHALRIARDDAAGTETLTQAFLSSVGRFSTPVLLTLRNLLPTRTQKAAVRIFWPKGQVAKGVSSPDIRRVLQADVVRPVVKAIEVELLQRFSRQQHYDSAIVDAGLKSILAPFNERTAARSAVALPRGSSIPVDPGKIARLFLHWCQPRDGGHTTDLDLSVGFYGADWKYVGVCSYYQLKCQDRAGHEIATSAGDRQDAPFPRGATEFIDLDLDVARACGVRYAVMVINAYAGMPFALLERGFAGLMFREDVGGRHFDPRTVKLKFELHGDNGIILPLVFDVDENTLHWLDTHSKGEFQFNNVERSNSAIQKICPEMIEYFGSGIRISMYELALMHAAARTNRVLLRGKNYRRITRDGHESNQSFFERLCAGVGVKEWDGALPDDCGSVFAALYQGDVDLPVESACYPLFDSKAQSTLSASDLIVS